MSIGRGAGQFLPATRVSRGGLEGPSSKAFGAATSWAVGNEQEELTVRCGITLSMTRFGFGRAEGVVGP